MSGREKELDAMSDEELQDALNDYANSSGDHEEYEIEEELEYRGYKRVRNGKYIMDDSGNPVVLGIILALIALAIYLSFFGFVYAVSYAVYFSKIIYVAFFLGIVFVGRGKGRSKLANFFFYLVSMALVTRMYPAFIPYIPYDQEFVDWFMAESTTFGQIAKSTFFYFLSILVVPWVFLRLVVMIARDNAKSRYPRYPNTNRDM